MKRQKRSVRTLILVVLAGLLLPLLASAAPAPRPEKPPAGMGLYIVALHDPPPPPASGKAGPPDIPALGGRVLQRIMNRQLVYLPLGVSKGLRKNETVAYVQRVWVGEPASEWDEQDDPADAVGRVAANAEEEEPTWFSGDYAYDGAGNITAVGTGAAYSYDSAGRLIKSMTAGVTETYGYDSFGNLTSRVRGGFPVVTTAVDPATNRLTGRLHDSVGNVTSDRNGVPYEYDAAGMITGMTATNGQRRRMLYTADDERIAVSTSDLTRVRIRDFDGKVLRELTQYENQSWAEWGRDYIYANGALVAGEREGSVANRERHYHLDHLGSVRLITTASGLRVSAHEYLPFGTELTDRTQEYQTFGPLYIKADPMKFTSHERDVTGLDNVDDSDYLDYMHARYYDGALGRFLSVDPLLVARTAVKRPQAWNRYAYVRNNPLGFVDPTGKYICRGWDSECGRFDTSLVVLRAAAFAAARAGIPGATRLNDLVKFYGKLGQDNRVHVEFGRTKDGAMTASMNPKTNVVTITVDRTSFVSVTGFFQIAVAQAHEGDHGLNMRADLSFATTRSRREKMWLETSAYRTQAYVNSALRVDDLYWQLWTNANGFDPVQITSWAAQSVAAACSYEPCTP